MQNDCSDIKEKLNDYINRRLSCEENCIVINHLAICKDCRREVALLIKIKYTVDLYVEGIPEQFFSSAFDKIPNENSVEHIINSDWIFKSFNLIRYAFSEVRKSVEFTLN